MSEFASLVDKLYSQFLLRDLAGKILPGALVMAAVWESSGPLSLVLAEFPSGSPKWAFVAALAWVMGLALQGAAELVRLLQYWPADVTRDKWYGTFVAFQRSQPTEFKQQLERGLVVGEASAIGCAGAVVATAISVARHWQAVTSLPGVGMVVLALLAALGLGFLHRRSRRRTWAFMRAAVAENA